MSSGYIGSPKNPLNIQTWRYSIPGTDIVNYRMLTETSPGHCIPVLQAEHGFMNGGMRVQLIDITNRNRT